MTTIIIEKMYDGDYRVKLHSDDQGIFKLCVETLKSFISPLFRQYDPATKHWLIAGEGYGPFTRWLSYCHINFHAQIKQSSAGGQQKAKASTTTLSLTPEAAAFKTLHLRDTAPPELIKAAYRILAQKHHPDHQGDTQAMQQINAAYELLTRQIAA